MTTARELFEYAGARYLGVAAWGTSVPLTTPGVYAISTSESPDESRGSEEPPLDPAAVGALISVRPDATVDGQIATPDLLFDRLRHMWPSGEPVVYVGLAGTNTQQRIEQFYDTALGARAPHAGGWPVKTLDTATLWVHYGATPDPAAAEAAMIHRFMAGLAEGAARSLVDPSAPLPFANLTFPRGRRKAHGMRGFKSPRTPGAGGRTSAIGGGPSSASSSTDETRASDGLGTTSNGPERTTRPTQNITQADVARGQIRIPRASKSIFPAAKGSIALHLRGQTVQASWDPRTEVFPERSGVIRIGKAVLSRYISSGGPISITTTAEGYRIS